MIGQDLGVSPNGVTRSLWINESYCVFIWITQFDVTNVHVNGLVQNCSNSIANALELLQSSTKPSIYVIYLIALWLFPCFASISGRKS